MPSLFKHFLREDTKVVKEVDLDDHSNSFSTLDDTYVIDLISDHDLNDGFNTMDDSMDPMNIDNNFSFDLL